MHKVAICSEGLLKGHDFHIVTLRHPKTRESSQCAFTQDYTVIHEILLHEPECGSWFIDKTISSDGSIILITRLDPVFLVLPYLTRHYNENPERYSPLEQILEDEEFPHTRKLCRCKALSHLEVLSDMKGAEDYKAYRYNQEKTLNWLQKKAERLSSYLQTSAHRLNSAQSAHFVRSKTDKDCPKEDYMLYSFGIISDYLSPELSALLREHLGLPKEVRQSVQDMASNKKLKTGSSSEGPTDDYSKRVLTEKQPAAAEKKPSLNQRKLAKIDKTGMKSITSFFSSKPKKPAS